MPRTKRPAGTTVDRRNGRRTELERAPQDGRLALPVPPTGVDWCADAIVAWERFWADPVAMTVTPADEVLVLRWLEALNRYLLMSRQADQSPMVLGSQGQEVLNPLYKAAEMALRTAEACERQLGIGPAHRASLGIALMAEKKTLASMNAQYVKGVVVRDEAADDDPRRGGV